jgi:hypothetical protein
MVRSTDPMKRLYLLVEGQTEETFVRELLTPHYAHLDLFISPIIVRTSPGLQLMPDYQKTFHGPLIAAEIGLVALRGACPHFNEWLTKLEMLAA